MTDPTPDPMNFQELYNLLHPHGKSMLQFVDEYLAQGHRFYFWSNEDVLIGEGRIKDGMSLKEKMEKKNLMPTDIENVCCTIKDFVGTRIIVTFRNQIQRAIELVINKSNPWQVRPENMVVYTNDPDDAKIYESMGLRVESKVTGYVGVHLDLKVELPDNPIHWVEVQIRTKIQDAWESIDHLLYKVGDDLPLSFLTLRKSLAGQFESSEKGQGFIFDYVQDEVVSKHPAKKFLNYFNIYDWSKDFGAPRDLIGKVIHGPTLDCYHLVDDDLGRHTLVEDPSQWPQKLITERWLQVNHPDILKHTLLVPNDFLAGMILSDSVAIKDLKQELFL